MPWEMVMLMWFGFFVKHLLMDFFVQNRFPFMWMNKGKIFHPGGWLHALTHAVGSYAVLSPVAGLFEYERGEMFYWERLLWATLIFEFFVHFGIDFLKVRISQWRGWKCNTSPYFWDLLGIDQFLHSMTYWFIILVWAGIFVQV